MNKDIITVNQLIRIAEEKTWEDFEAMPDGRLVLQDHAQTLLRGEEPISPLLWVFEMRVGLHFERPMQAIMSCGHFIRMRSTNENWKSYPLKKLDPARPVDCLYHNSHPFMQDFQVTWRPALPQDLPPGAGVGQLQGSWATHSSPTFGVVTSAHTSAHTSAPNWGLQKLASAMGLAGSAKI